MKAFYFFFLVLFSVQWSAGGLLITAARIFVLLYPFTLIFSKNLIVFHVADYIYFFLCANVFISLSMVHSFSEIDYSIILFFEMVSPYLFARFAFRNQFDFHQVIFLFGASVVLLAPFAVVETFLGFNFWSWIFDFFGDPLRSELEFRLLGVRARSVFAHPIHFGFYATLLLPMVFYSNRSRWWKLLVVTSGLVCVLAAQSSAALLALGVQALLLLFGNFLRQRWGLLFLSVSSLVLFLNTFSNRGAVGLIIAYLTLNPRTAYWRVHLWNFGWDSVWEHPLFGVGLGDWSRPHWLASTIDNYFLMIAVRYGFLSFVLILSFVSILLALLIRRVRKTNPDFFSPFSYVIVTFVSAIFVLATVSVWGQMQFFLSFFFGLVLSFALDDGVELNRGVGSGLRQGGSGIGRHSSAGGPRFRR